MTKTFTELLEMTQQSIENQLAGKTWNPISVITGTAQLNTAELSEEEIASVLSSEPRIWHNIILPEDLSSPGSSLLEVAKRAICVEIEKQVDMTPFSDAVKEWFGRTHRTPEHLQAKMEAIVNPGITATDRLSG